MKFLVLIIFLFSTAVFPQTTNAERRNRILEIIEEELSEIKRLTKTTSRQRPSLLLRKAELTLEKARLIKERENEEFLAVPAIERRKMNKERFFRTSNYLFREADRICAEITKRYPKFKDIGEVYFILGFNAKEFGRDKSANKYFTRARKNSKSSSVTYRKSLLAQAELYYNYKLYKKAYPLYESALNAKDRWWTKDALNLAWSYIKSGKKKKGLNTILRAYELSKDDRYVDVSVQVERDIGYFYVENNRLKDAINFYKVRKKSFSKNIKRVADLLTAQGQATKAERLYLLSMKYEEERWLQLETMVSLMVFYEKYNKYFKHYKYARIVKQEFKELSGASMETYIFQLKKVSVRLQNSLSRRNFKKVNKNIANKGKISIEYKRYLIELDPRNINVYNFQIAEVAYLIKDYKTSIEYYDKVMNAEKFRAGEKKYYKQSIEGALFCLGEKSLPDAIKEKYYENTYNKFLQIEKRSERAKEVYVRLYNYYLDKENSTCPIKISKKGEPVTDCFRPEPRKCSQVDIPKDENGNVRACVGQNSDQAEDKLIQFSKFHPGESQKQEAMIAKLIDFYQARKEKEKVKRVSSSVFENNFKVSNKFRGELKKMLTSMQIEDAQDSLQQGDKKTALINYEQVATKSHSTKEAKVNANYNLAILQYDLNKPTQSYYHLSKSINMMSTPEIRKYVSTIINLGNYYFSQLFFELSGNISFAVLTKLCRYRNEPNVLIAFKNAFYTYLSEELFTHAESTLREGKKCPSVASSQDYKNAIIELAKDYIDGFKITNADKWINELNKIPNQSEQVAKLYARIVQKFFSRNKTFNKKYFDKMNKIYRQMVRRSNTLDADILEVVGMNRNRVLAKEAAAIDKIILAFPESNYNKRLKQKLDKLQSLTEMGKSIQRLGAGKAIVESTLIISTAYENFSYEIERFTPPGKPKEYVSGFKKAMEDIWKPLRLESERQKDFAKDVVLKNNLVSPLNNSLFGSAGKLFFALDNLVLMERSN